MKVRCQTIKPQSRCYSPPLEEGWTRPQENIAEGILKIGADGVVRNVFAHPVCASKVASQAFLDRAGTPPPEEGVAVAHYFVSSSRTSTPPFITNFTRSISVMSVSGFPETAMMSAYLPFSMVPM